ncbi:MAG TPA: PEP/pyruvate-binding domain-containing protein [Polyangiaceae bacterium]|nr:PEP/pyruvate-binding domain-containing protein [Polyangiaceae bacterium]
MLFGVLLGVLLSACGSSSSSEPPPAPTQCSEATARVGGLACLHRLTSDAEWQSISVGLPTADRVRAAKYLVPAAPQAALDTLFMNSKRFALHYDFLRQVFPDLFPGLSPNEYLALLFDPNRRQYYVGDLAEYHLPTGEVRFGFTLVTDPKSPEAVSCDDLVRVHAALASRLYGEDLYVVPYDKYQLGFAPRCGLPLLDPSQTLSYEVYHEGVGFGTLRRYSAGALKDAITNADFGFRDLLVLEEAPTDVETVVSGVVTSSRQTPLSHLAVRSASRGTPNCFQAGAFEALAPWEDQLVRIECGAGELLVRGAELEEAEAFWSALRPTPVELPDPDLEFMELPALEQVPTDGPAQRALALRRFGAKAMNLAWLRQNMARELTPMGFVIPVAHYAEFMENTTWQTDLGSGSAAHSFADTLAAWLADPIFRTDAKVRKARLLQLQDAMVAAPCDAELQTSIAESIRALVGSESTTLRFRSSSNAEDGVTFNGAGLYDSYSGCLADDLDADDAGPSICDPEERKERSVCRALKRVWASLWNPRAYDERDFYGIEQARVMMGVLVNERSEKERANMVVFNGNPARSGDARYLVNAQIGELAVVSPEPGVWPEQVLLTLRAGEVSNIERIAASSETAVGLPVLSDAELRALGAHMAQLSGLYPFDVSAPAGHTLLLDTEWKVMPDGSLRIKQVRPFSRRDRN